MTAGGATLAYDANGNLTSDGSTTFAYDAENRLLSASGATTATMVYDPLGGLFETSGGAAGVTRFLYDGDELVAEYDAAGTMLRRYVHGAGTDDPLIWYEGAALTDRRSLQSDHQGSIVSVANSTGAVIALNSYDSWGVRGAGNIGRFQYTGQAWIPELGMYYYKARIYSPTLGRFLQTDPVGYEDQVNLYAYVGNDPVNGTDPSGSDAVTCQVIDDKLTPCTLTKDDNDYTTVTVIRIESYQYEGNTYFRNRGTSTTTIDGSISKGWSFFGLFGERESVLSQVSSFLGQQVGIAGLTYSLPSPRVSLLERVQNLELKRTINELYRPNAKIGNGSAMDAHRSDGSHSQKLLERRTQLQRILKDPNLSPSDKQVVKQLLMDIQNSLAGK